MTEQGLAIRDRGIFKGTVAWLKVSPVEWLVDSESSLLVSRYSLLSGIPADMVSSFVTCAMREDMFALNLMAQEQEQKQEDKKHPIEDDLSYIQEQLHLAQSSSTYKNEHISSALDRLDTVSNKIMSGYQKVK